MSRILYKVDWKFNMKSLRTVPFKQKSENNRLSESVIAAIFVRCLRKKYKGQRA